MRSAGPHGAPRSRPIALAGSSVSHSRSTIASAGSSPLARWRSSCSGERATRSSSPSRRATSSTRERKSRSLETSRTGRAAGAAGGWVMSKRYTTARRARRGSVPSVRRPHELDVRLDPNRVRDEDAARLDRLVPPESPVAAIDFPPGAEAGALLPPRVHTSPLEHAVERDLHRRVADRQVAHQPEACSLLAAWVPLHPGTPEGDRRKALRIEEVRRAQVGVAARVARVDARRGDLDLDAAPLRVLLAPRDGRLHVFEAAT